VRLTCYFESLATNAANSRRHGEDEQSDEAQDQEEGHEDEEFGQNVAQREAQHGQVHEENEARQNVTPGQMKITTFYKTSSLP